MINWLYPRSAEEIAKNDPQLTDEIPDMNVFFMWIFRAIVVLAKEVCDLKYRQ